MIEIKVCFFRIQSATLVFRGFWHDWPCNPEIPRPTVSATVRSWIAFACIALWLRSSLIYWKQSNKGGIQKTTELGNKKLWTMQFWSSSLKRVHLILCSVIERPRSASQEQFKVPEDCGRTTFHIPKLGRNGKAWTSTEVKYLFAQTRWCNVPMYSWMDRLGLCGPCTLSFTTLCQAQRSHVDLR